MIRLLLTIALLVTLAGCGSGPSEAELASARLDVTSAVFGLSEDADYGRANLLRGSHDTVAVIRHARDVGVEEEFLIEEINSAQELVLVLDMCVPCYGILERARE